MEVDHVVPLDKGGDPWDPANLQTLCRGCHVAKTAAENRRPLTPAEAEWRVLVAGTDQNAAIHLYTHERACPEARSARGRGCPRREGAAAPVD